MSFATGLGRDTPRGDFIRSKQDRVRTKPEKPIVHQFLRTRSKSVSGAKNFSPRQDSPPESPAPAKILRGRARKSSTEKDFNVALNATGPITLTRPPSATNKKTTLSQTQDLNKKIVKPEPKKPMIRSLSVPARIGKVAQDYKFKKNPNTSQRTLNKKGLEKLRSIGSTEPTAVPRGRSRKTEQEPQLEAPSRLSDALLEKSLPPMQLSIYKPGAPVTELPDLSPGRIIKEKLSTSVTFDPVPRVEIYEAKEREEDQGGGEARIQMMGLPGELSPRMALVETCYFLLHVVEMIDDTLEWSDIEQLEHIAPHIARLLNSELLERDIDSVKVDENPENWLVANDALIKNDGPRLKQLTDRILPDLQEMGYFKGQHPSPWQVLFMLQTDMKAANAIIKLDFSNLGLSEFPLCIGRLCLRKVRMINCDGNQFKMIPPMLFGIVPNVESVSFSRNHITTYPSEIFFDLRRLAELNLSAQLDGMKRSISEMVYNVGIWYQTKSNLAKKLIRVDLSSNQIAEIHPDRFTKATTDVLPVEIDMKGNPVNYRKITESNNERGMVYDPVRKIHELAKLILNW